MVTQRRATGHEDVKAVASQQRLIAMPHYYHGDKWTQTQFHDKQPTIVVLMRANRVEEREPACLEQRVSLQRPRTTIQTDRFDGLLPGEEQCDFSQP